MFKLVKILNSGTNVAEPTHVPADPNISYRAGTFATLTHEGVLQNVPLDDSPTHLVGETLKAGEKDTVLCYPINKDMIFETEVGKNYADYMSYTRLAITYVDGIATSAGFEDICGPLVVYDLLGASKPTDPILVKIR